jgi:DNA polymerase-3 subunit alpha
MPTEFVHLRTHSHYSLLTAPVRVPGLIEAAQACGQTALGLTDSGNLFGAIEFYKSCRDVGIKPVLGMIAHCAAHSCREPGSIANPSHQLTLLAADATGWENLRRLSTHGFLAGFHYRPRIDRELLACHRDGLVVLSGDHTGEVSRLLQAGEAAAAGRIAGEFQELLGKDNYFLEITATGSESEARVNPALVELRDRLGIPLVATNDVHYVRPEDWIAQEILLCIRNGKTINDPSRPRMPSRELWFKSTAQMAERFAEEPQALRSTVEIAERCSVQLDFNTYHLPVFRTGTGEAAEDLFTRLCIEGTRARYSNVTDAVTQRLEMEMSIIRQLGFCSYFLITADFVAYARKNGIPVGPGRGSAAGSIVAYALGITELDPLRYNLLFERFLNASRISMPDIDIDFCGARRDEVIEYVRHKYGSDCVCQIITFGTMASRGVLRDVGRVLELPLPEIDRIAKKVPQGPGASLQKALEADAELRAIRDESTATERLFELSLKLEGLARHSSIHAAGVVLADRPLADYVPLCKNGEDVTTQWQMTELEEVGLLKVDFLGLKTLTILQEATRLIAENRGEHLELGAIPLDDSATFALMTRGETLGVFQLESSGMRELLARLAPDTFEDVIAVLALYRPGPLGSGMVDMFVRRKHGHEPIAYPHDSLAEILGDTYGVIVYQEQVMRIANVLAGFSMNEADSLRKAMGKKKPEVMAKFKEKFVDGAAGNGHDKKFARELFETIEYFAGYGFNKSHSAAYALITFQTAYLKAHYLLEFMAANMTIESGNSDKLKDFVDEARRLGIEVRPPDVNRSESFFSVEDRSIRFGLGAIKGVGTRLAESIAKARRETGDYRSLEGFCERHDHALLNRASLEAMVKAGAFDSIERHRRSAIDGLDGAIRTSAMVREDRRRGQGNLFAFDAPPATPSSNAEPEWGEAERLAKEKESLGFYLSGHPFEKRGRFLTRLAGYASGDLDSLEHGASVRLAGMITGVRTMVVKSGANAGSKMARFQLEDLDKSIPVVVFAKSYEQIKSLIVGDAIVFASGRLDKSNDECSLLLDRLEHAESVMAAEVDCIVVELSAGTVRDETLDRIVEALGRWRGDQRLLIRVHEDGATFDIRTDRRFGVRVSDGLLDDLAGIVGADSLSFARR